MPTIYIHNVCITMEGTLSRNNYRYASHLIILFLVPIFFAIIIAENMEAFANTLIVQLLRIGTHISAGN